MIQASFINAPLDDINELLSQSNPNPVDFETMFYYNELLNWLVDIQVLSALHILLTIQGEVIAQPKENDEPTFGKSNKKATGWIKTKTPPYQRREDFNLNDIFLQGPLDIQLNDEKNVDDEICGFEDKRNLITRRIWALDTYPTTLIRVYRSGLIDSLINFDEILPQWEGLQVPHNKTPLTPHRRDLVSQICYCLRNCLCNLTTEIIFQI